MSKKYMSTRWNKSSNANMPKSKKVRNPADTKPNEETILMIILVSISIAPGLAAIRHKWNGPNNQRSSATILIK
jgi:hypothetical protein